LFFQDNARVYAVSLESGVVLPGWAASYGDRGGQFVAPGANPLPRNQQMTVTVTDSSVLAVTGQIDVQQINQLGGMGLAAVGERETRLVCLDRASGKERWSVTARQLPDAVAPLRNLALSGSPLVVGDNVYVLGRGGKPMQFEDSYVLCYSLRDGTYRWSCYIASGNTDPNGMQGAMGLMGENVTHLAYDSGRLYALTNLGALAAIDAYSGTIVWLNIYPRPKPDFAGLGGRWNRAETIVQAPKPWMYNPVIVKDGKVFILPADAQHVLVYDAGSGVEVQRIRTSDFESAKTLLAIVGERMLLCGDRSIFCIDWQQYDSKLPDRESNLFWSSTFLRQNYAKDSIRGRGFVTTDSVFIPTAWNLQRLSLKSGRVEQTYPREREWDAGEGPGNVLVTQDHVILATTDRVNVYTDLTVARAKLDAEVDAAPTDPEPRLRYAEMMFVSNQLDIAVDKLDEAMSLLGGGAAANAMRPGAQRDRVFNIALTFAQKLADPAAPGTPEERKLAEGLFDRASVAADAPQQQVNYRMTRARFSEPPDQVRLYQEILADERLRAIPFAGESGSASQASAVAEAEISRLVQTLGRDVYAPFEAKAAEALAAARSAKDPNTLLAVAQVYPNAQVAPEAMLAAADAYEAAGNPRGATHVLNQIFRKYRSAFGAARIVEAQVRNNLKLPGNVGAAIGKLQPAYDKAMLTKPIQLPDGTTLANVPLKAVRDALYAYSAKTADAALPDFGLPAGMDRKREKPLLPERPDTAIPDVDQLVVPHRDFANHNRIVAWTAGKGIAIYAVGQPNPLGSHAPFTDTPKGAAWVDGGKLLVWGPTRAILLAGETGATVWEVAIKGMPQLDVAGPGANDVIVDAGAGAEVEGMAIEMRQRRLPVRARGFPGNVPNNVLALQPPPAPAQQPGAPELIDLVCPTGDRAIVSTNGGRLFAIELAGGKVAWQARLLEGPVTQLLANDDFTVARFADASGVQLVALDTYSGQPAGPRRVFPVADPSRQPINMALSPDGTLVFTTHTQLCAKNLFDPAKELNFQKPNPSDAMPRYQGANLPDQLVIANGRIITLTDNGSYVRVHSLETGELVPAPNQFSTYTNNWGVRLRTIASRLYVVNQRNFAAQNLDRADDFWKGDVLIDPPIVVREAM
ncbi:MAG: PQQ-binding-like beta-propeller repeat protein, partial [Tepidisphaeraceae bacterium]